jgi:hypothetical protein
MDRILEPAVLRDCRLIRPVESRGLTEVKRKSSPLWLWKSDRYKMDLGLIGVSTWRTTSGEVEFVVTWVYGCSFAAVLAALTGWFSKGRCQRVAR